ncbi:hypothetical protein DFA_03126 [Cavenderia fasciculata]|uniref:Transmembrane protein n=1 Tax=Cavenderia fasciculata TaxID=261658 RepID=F4PGP7_CACFS|nr:uncharacterized protein DFA_03126 [Cavenderia fasciculata]EGG24881.1 hypothetical protein DFA_03126 [Cavenderia fasciculata]|eukprot:XP_004362732.1 hypothetical protein DFA_03126 [Cavenderia fasciculata]
MLEVQKVVIFADSHCYTKLFQNEEFENFVVVNIDTLTPSTDLNGFFKNERDAACLCISKNENYYKILNGHYQPLISKILATLSSLVCRTNLSLFIVFENKRKEVNQKHDFMQEIEEKQPIFKNLGRCYGMDSMWFGMDKETIKDKIYDGKQTNSFQWLDPSSSSSSRSLTNAKVILCALLFLFLGIVKVLVGTGQLGSPDLDRNLAPRYDHDKVLQIQKFFEEKERQITLFEEENQSLIKQINLLVEDHKTNYQTISRLEFENKDCKINYTKKISQLEIAVDQQISQSHKEIELLKGQIVQLKQSNKCLKEYEKY